MITREDVVVMELSTEDVENCKQNPVADCNHKGTGQLKAVGNMVIQRLFGISQDDMTEHAQTIKDSGVACARQLRDHSLAGVAATVSMIKDDNILTKRVIVPANQLYKHPSLDSHYTVGVFVQGSVDANKELTSVSRVYVAGWTSTQDLKRWLKKEGDGPFRVKHVSLAIAPCDILAPVQRLKGELCWKQFQV